MHNCKKNQQVFSDKPDGDNFYKKMMMANHYKNLYSGSPIL